MSPSVKQLLKRTSIYYPIQGFYRRAIFTYNKLTIQQSYKKYRGEGYNCNYCFASYTKFAPWQPDPQDKEALAKNDVIAGYGENILCPNCLSTARERLLKAMFDEAIAIDRKKILHMSPEKKCYNFIKETAIVTTVDYLPQLYKNIDPLIRFADATQLSFDNGTFDIVIGNHIMEHIPDDRQAMSEIYRVLQPGGIAILQVPFSETIPDTIEEPGIDEPARQSALFGQHDHVRIYSLNDYMDRLRKVGFTVEYLSYASLERFYCYAIQKDEGFISVKK